jgi:hypothetical protein
MRSNPVMSQKHKFTNLNTNFAVEVLKFLAELKINIKINLIRIYNLPT